MNGFIRIFREDFPGHRGRPGFRGGSLPRLSRKLLDPEERGFSYNVASSTSPTEGYMVSTYKELEFIIPTPLADFKGKEGEEGLMDEIHAFAKRNKHLLILPEHYLGGWVEDGMVFLDVSIRVKHQRTAIKLAKKHNQLSFYALRGETVRV